MHRFWRVQIRYRLARWLIHLALFIWPPRARESGDHGITLGMALAGRGRTSPALLNRE
jgi:hypothetical protein